MLVLVGASASGKSAVAKELQSRYGMEKFVTCTTRPMRINEVAGVDYHFMDEAEFLHHQKGDEFIETVYYNHHYYGSLKADVSDNKVIILEPSGLKKYYDQMIDVFAVYLDTPEAIRLNRMINRGDGEDESNKRIQADRLVFNKSILPLVDLYLDTSIISTAELATIIYQKYQDSLNKKSQ